MKKIFYFLSALLICYSVSVFAVSSSPWSTMALRDLQAIKQAVDVNYPGAGQYKSLHFRNWFSDGYEQAREKAKQVHNFASYITILRYYANGFQEPHIYISPLLFSSHYSWPGFISSLRNGKLIVVYSSKLNKLWKTLPPKGSEILACDSDNATQIMKRQLLPYYGIKNQPASWARASSYTFQHGGSPWRKAYKQCSFKTPNGIQYVTLHWRYMSPAEAAGLNKIYNAASFGKKPKFAIRQFAPKSVWLSIPTFGLQARKQLRRISRQIRKYRNYDLIVFDMRGNGGGNMKYARTIIYNLFSKPYIESKGDKHIWNHTWRVQWRVSKGNLKAIEQRGDKRLAAEFRRQLALGNSGNISGTFKLTSYQLGRTNKKVSDPVSAKVIVLTDGRCSSACWLFTRSLNQLPGVVHAGQATYVMDRYANARGIVLPSGAAKIFIPMMSFTHPLNQYGESLIPKYVYPGYMGDTEKLQQWILNDFK